MSAATAAVVGLEASSDARDSPTRWPSRASRWCLAAAAAAAILREGDAGNIDGDGDAAGAREDGPDRGGLRGGSRRDGDPREASAAAMAAARATRPREGDARSAGGAASERGDAPAAGGDDMAPPRRVPNGATAKGCEARPADASEGAPRGRDARRWSRNLRPSISRPPTHSRGRRRRWSGAVRATSADDAPWRFKQRRARRARIGAKSLVCYSKERRCANPRPIKPRAPIAKKKHFDRRFLKPSKGKYR